MISPQRRIEPGARIGVFGGGQLGRMMAHAAQRMGYHVVVFTPDAESPAGQVAQESIVADYEDPDAVRDFAQSVEVITLEFENIQLQAVDRASEFTPVRPNREVLRIAQHRIVEKTTLQQAGFPVTPFVAVHHPQDLQTAIATLGLPMILKTATWGYDGKGQRKVGTLEQAQEAVALLGPGPIIAEKLIRFQCEVSILVARNALDQIVSYPLLFNEHSNHILDVTRCPAPEGLKRLESRAAEIASNLIRAIDCVGLMCIEFFVDSDGELMINEIAPRPHNSGHLTMEACVTSQFEQQVRAITNQPLGSSCLNQPAAMANLLGDVWSGGMPRYEKALAEPQCYLHLYGKTEPKLGRKMGHLTCLDASSSAAADRARRLRDAISHRSPKLFD